MQILRSVWGISRLPLEIKSLPFRPLACILIALLACSTSNLAAREIVAIDGTSLGLDERLIAPKTLVLVARDKTQLRESFRLLTLAESKQLPTLILIELPVDQPVQSMAIKRAARSFITSDYGRRRIYFIQQTASQTPTFTDIQSLLLSSEQKQLWHSNAYPEDGDFDTEAFQP